MEVRQKTLNQAFNAILIYSGITIFFWWLLSLTMSYVIEPLSIVEIILYLVLGYLTKMSVKNASVFLLLFFIVERMYWVLRYGTTLGAFPSNVTPAIIFTFITLTMWGFIYRAFIASKYTSLHQ